MLVSICMATYNGAKYIKEQMDSILSQRFKENDNVELEIIVSDDGSTDDTISILESYHDSRIKIFHHKNYSKYKYFKANRLASSNFENAITKATGDYLFLADQDDVWLPTKVEHTYEKLKETDADLVFTDLEVVNEKLETIYPSFNDFMLLSRKIKKYLHSYRLQYLYNCVTGCTLMSKKKFIKMILPIPTQSKYAIHDTWIACTVANNGKMEYLDEKTIKYRQHGNNQVGTDKISHKFSKLQQVRDLFIEVKLGLFRTYVENDRIFNDELKEKNKKALNYFEMIKDKKHINLKQWNVFHDLYKTETLSYYLLNFFIMNLPGISKGLFAIRYGVLKILGKR